MHEEIEYAEMLEIPVSTVNVVRKNRRKKQRAEEAEKSASLKESVLASLNDRLDAEPAEPAETPIPAETESVELPVGGLEFDPVPERIDTVRLYDTNGEGERLYPREYELNEGGMYAVNPSSKKVRIALGVEFGVACALCCGIFLTNVFMPNSAINTFFRAIATPTDAVSSARPYTDFTLSPVVSEHSAAKLNLSPSGILSFTDECFIYPAADGKVCELVKDGDGLYTLKIEYSDSFTGVFTSLDSVYYAVGDSVKSNVPVGYSEGEAEVQVTMYSHGQMLNCFELTEENCLAWISTAE